ncbi:MAG: hypothetical protein HKN40_08820 [Winogradskyella sp.]|uniref:hypothetical protein n=1 Tax=Winogradskyella sp. TaxID=1883156 RepID=UPI001828DD39|nr:hypothetical protein [Winogradskyella sp.]
MRHEEISSNLKNLSFEFFYWFSRFEFTLKENGFLKSEQAHAKAEPSWEKFREMYKNDYNISHEANDLIKLHPKRQVVTDNMRLGWVPVGLDHCDNDFCKVITMLTTIRNNLFHGGKHGDGEVDDINRNLELLRLGKEVLDDFANQFNFVNDYTRYY